MTLSRQVNGKKVELTAQEETDFLAESEANKPVIYARLIYEIRNEGMQRLKQIFPTINNIDELKLVAEQWLSIDPTARQPTADFKKAIDIYTAAKVAIAYVKAFTIQAEVDGYDVQTGPSWPN
jgi:hypothetical protein